MHNKDSHAAREYKPFIIPVRTALHCLITPTAPDRAFKWDDRRREYIEVSAGFVTLPDFPGLDFLTCYNTDTGKMEVLDAYSGGMWGSGETEDEAEAKAVNTLRGLGAVNSAHLINFHAAKQGISPRYTLTN